MQTGTLLSLGSHGALLGWLLLGNVFQHNPEPLSVQEVSVISAEQFASLSRPIPTPLAPDITTDVAVPPPVIPQPPEASVRPVEREILEPPPAEAPSLLPETPPPAPDVSEEPAPRPADRVAATPAPETTAAPDPIPQQEIANEGEAEVNEPVQDALAPPEATTEIVTEADRPSGAPLSSLRPPAVRPSPPSETAAASEPPSEALAAALAEALAETAPASTTPVPSGPPLTGGERENLRIAVSSCWMLGALSTDASETKVTVYVRMTPDARPDINSIRLVSHQGGTEGSARRVFDTARRAIILCGRRGFPLPQEKYDQWREIEMTFNPEGMFWR